MVLAALLLDARAHRSMAQTATITALTGQSCAGTRYGADLGCTANDFSSSLTFDQPSASALSSCVAGQTVSIDVLAQITSNSPTRYDGAYFIGEVGTSPELNDATKTCSLGVFPTSPLPFQTWDTDVCGDYAATAASTLLINDVAVQCTPAAGTNQLAIPYVLVFSNTVGGSTCTAANVTANTKSKCVSSVTATVTGVTVNGYIQITKQTLPDGHSQAFGFTTSASGGATVTPSTFNLTDGTTQRVEVPFTSSGGATTLTLTETAVSGWDTTASITCATPAGASASSYVTVNNTNRTISAVLTPTDFGAVCTITNTKIPTVKVKKVTSGGYSGPFAFAQTNLASTPADITTTAIGTAAPASPTAINVTTIGSAVSLTETLVTGYRLTGAACADSESGLTGNTGSIGTLSGMALPIPAANVKAGSEFTCTFTNARIPALTLQKVTLGASAGPFSFCSTNLASTPGNITTATSGTAAPVSPSAIDVSTIGQDVTITEAAVTGYQLTGASCTDANSGVTGNTGSFGSLSGQVLTIPAVNVVPGAQFQCTFTNRKIPLVKVQKITSGGTGGPFTFTQTNLGSTPSNITTTSIGTAAPASPSSIQVTTTGSDVTVTETLASGFSISAASCTDANSAITGNSGSIGSLSGTVLTIPAANVVAGADFTCTFSNARIPTLTLQKVTLGSAGGPFAFSASNLASALPDITTTVPGTAAPASPSAIDVSTIGQDITVAETVVSGYAVVSASCSDANSTVTGNTGTFGTLSGATLTIAAANAVAGARFNCTFTNRRIPTVKVQKVTLVGAGGPFTFTQTNLDSTPLDITTSAIGTAAPASPSAIQVTTSGSGVTITEGVATGYFITSAACSDANSAVTGNSGSIGTLTGTVLTIPGANIVNGADFTCSFTNTLAVPELTVAKSASVADADAAGDAITYTITVSNSGNVTVTSITVSDPLGAVTCATSGTAAIATLAPGGVETCSLSYSVTQADFDTGGGGDDDIDNTATAAGSYGAVSVQGAGSTSVALLVNPALQVAKTANDTTDVTAGQVITYTYIVTNTGNQTISNAAMGDSHNASGPVPVPGNETLTLDSGTIGDSTDVTAANGTWSVLAPGDAVTFTATYTVTQADVDQRQ